MIDRRPALFVVTVLACAAAPAAVASPTLADVFGDAMVLQRDRDIVLWGDAEPGSFVTVSLAGQSTDVEADAGGSWRAELEALPAGGPHSVTLAADGEESTAASDVLIGDVWLCSGQSNMAWPLSASSGNPRDILARRPSIRLLTIPRDAAVEPRAAPADAVEWRIADEQSIPEFSAVCYLFARQLAADSDVPLGLIHASWGGSRIEAWLSREALGAVDGYAVGLDLLTQYAADRKAGERAYGRAWADWWSATVDESSRPWLDPAAAGDWQPVPSIANWKSWPDAGLQGHDGMLWYRRTVEVTAEQAAQDAELALGGIDEIDLAWINGRLVGTQFGWGTPRRYAVPAGVLRAGDNEIVVNVLSTWDAGGLVGPAAEMALEFPGDRIPLGSDWHYRKVPAGLTPPRAPWESIGGLTGLYNAMLSPLAGLPLAGALWYQGESNAGDAGNYDELLAALTGDWRKRFVADLPVIVIQLPNFGQRRPGPVQSGWATIRDAQRRVARAEERTGLVVTIDAGDDFDLHPANKRVVARRAANVARVLAGRNGIADGLSPVAARRTGYAIELEFPETAELVVIGDRRPVGFELCRDDAGSCRYAEAILANGRILVMGDLANTATRVRHCWADAPICNLFGASGLPVSTFEVAIVD